ncbi:MAG: potassium-transporting ATPase subunit KdpC [Firmicutes bacterium]|nr:potassium-transporting ATPase subunit KdpC [Alicyclobacillaceae bacterium]MCL6497803.1 potassium-transporting ATPase subunit KdpC [Bacillota bacterium]
MWRAVLVVSAGLWLLVGWAYPLAMVGISQAAWPNQANGSILYYRGKAVGTPLLGQAFNGEPGFFWGRPSATVNAAGQPDPYNPLNSGPSNLGPDSRALVAHVARRIHQYLESTPGLTVSEIPASLVESSGSGLDPDISPQSAAIQIPRVSRATGLSPAVLRQLIAQATERPVFGLFGRPRVNVLLLNLELVERLGHRPKLARGGLPAR